MTDGGIDINQVEMEELRSYRGVVKPAVIPHSCDPGWTWKPIPEGGPLLLPGGMGGKYGVPPSPREFPKGTVWRCDCGRHWVSLGAPNRYSPGFCEWRPESRGERRRRLGLRWWQKEQP